MLLLPDPIPRPSQGLHPTFLTVGTNPVWRPVTVVEHHAHEPRPSDVLRSEVRGSKDARAFRLYRVEVSLLCSVGAWASAGLVVWRHTSLLLFLSFRSLVAE